MYLGKTERTLGITYVALSRVKQLSSLVIEPMTFGRLKQIKNSNSLRYRQEEEQRLKKLFSYTKKVFFPNYENIHSLTCLICYCIIQVCLFRIILFIMQSYFLNITNMSDTNGKKKEKKNNLMSQFQSHLKI